MILGGTDYCLLQHRELMNPWGEVGFVFITKNCKHSSVWPFPSQPSSTYKKCMYLSSKAQPLVQRYVLWGPRPSTCKFPRCLPHQIKLAVTKVALEHCFAMTCVSRTDPSPASWTLAGINKRSCECIWTDSAYLSGAEHRALSAVRAVCWWK